MFFGFDCETNIKYLWTATPKRQMDEDSAAVASTSKRRRISVDSSPVSSQQMQLSSLGLVNYEENDLDDSMLAVAKAIVEDPKDMLGPAVG